MKKNDNKETINQIIVKGYKAFDIDFSNPFTKEKLYPNNIYKLEGELGYKKNGYNFCTNLEDCLRYINGLEKEINICPIIALGDIFWYNDEIYEYYNLGCTNKIYIGKSYLVTAEVSGNKTVKKLSIEADSLEKDDIEMLEDMIVVAINDAMVQIDKETEQKMGKYTQGMPGLF